MKTKKHFTQPQNQFHSGILIIFQVRVSTLVQLNQLMETKQKKIHLGICVLNRHPPRHLWLLTRTHHQIFHGRVTDKEEKRKVSKHVGAFKVKWRKRFLVWWNQNGALCPSCKKFRLVDNKLGISTVSVNVLESNAGSSYLNPNPTGFGVALQRKLE